MYQPFRALDDRFEQGLRGMMSDEAEGVDGDGGKRLNGELIDLSLLIYYQSGRSLVSWTTDRSPCVRLGPHESTVL